MEMLLSSARCDGDARNVFCWQRCASGIGAQGCHTRGSHQIVRGYLYFGAAGAAAFPLRWSMLFM